MNATGLVPGRLLTSRPLVMTLSPHTLRLHLAFFPVTFKAFTSRILLRLPLLQDHCCCNVPHVRCVPLHEPPSNRSLFGFVPIPVRKAFDTPRPDVLIAIETTVVYSYWPLFVCTLLALL